MKINIFNCLAYLFVGITSLLLAVYISSYWLKPSEAAVPNNMESTPSASRNIAQTTPATTPLNAGDLPAQAGEARTALIAPTVNNQSAVDTGAAFLEPFLYDTREGRRNPFKPPAMIEAGSYSNQMLGPATPLERYELDELKLLAIIWDVKNPRAMFMDPSSEVHTVGKDDRIGRRRGYIAVIREGEVVVVESTTYGGEPVYTTRVLRMDR